MYDGSFYSYCRYEMSIQQAIRKFSTGRCLRAFPSLLQTIYVYMTIYISLWPWGKEWLQVKISNIFFSASVRPCICRLTMKYPLRNMLYRVLLPLGFPDEDAPSPPHTHIYIHAYTLSHVQYIYTHTYMQYMNIICNITVLYNPYDAKYYCVFFAYLSVL